MQRTSPLSVDRLGPWLTGGGMLAAVSQPFSGLIGLVAALACAVVLAARGRRLPAAAVAGVAVLWLLVILLATGGLGELQVEDGGSFGG